MGVNKCEDIKCVTCSTPRPGKGVSSVASKPSGSMLVQAADNTWMCDVCMIVSKAEILSCAVCTNLKTGSSVTKLCDQRRLKLGGSEGGLKLSDQGGLKLGGSGLKLGSEAVKLGGGLKRASKGEVKLREFSISRGFKLGEGFKRE